MSASLQPEIKSTSRRALLAGALGGIGALAASAIGRPEPTRADDEAIVVGGEYTNAITQTRIENHNSNAQVFAAVSSGDQGFGGGIGLYGYSDLSMGIFGLSSASNKAAILGQAYGNSTGVLGYSGGGSVPAAKAKTGVYGYAAQDSSSMGVWGHSPGGHGLHGSSSSGHAIHGVATTGFAGYFAGKVYTTKWYELSEINTPAAPATNRARLFVRDNGSSKTQLCVNFANGTIRILATEA